MNWLHSLDQLLFSVGAKCHTRIEFYRVMYELRTDRYYAVTSALSESMRAESSNVLATVVVNDPQETVSNIIKSKSILLDARCRNIIAQPSLQAALVEIECLDIILRDEKIDPASMYLDQRAENEIAALYQAFLELLSYGQVSVDTHAEFLARGMPLEFDTIEGIKSRDAFYESLTAYSKYEFVTPTFLKSMYDRVSTCLLESPNFKAYINQFGDNNAFLSILGENKSDLTKLIGN